METDREQNIIFFDGVCNLCNGAVQFIIKRDKDHVFKFASLQSETSRYLIGVDFNENTPESMLYLQGDKLYTRSDAALHIAKKLGYPWKLGYVFIVVPRFIRNAVYNFIARNRYRFFGKRDECMIPTQALKQRFL